MKKSFTSKSLRVGSYSIVATVIVIAIAVVINMMVASLPANLTKMDMTKNQFYTLSEQTKNLVSSLEDDVVIYLLAQGGSEDSTITQLLERYEGLNGKVRVETKDPVVFPNFAQQYTSEQISNNSLVVVSGGRSRYVSYNDIYVTSYTDYSTTNFNGESCVTSAIDYVTSKELPKIYALTGHGELTLDSAAGNAVQKANVQMASLNLLTLEGVPDDGDGLFIYSPARDISEVEKEKILSYLQKGGNLLLITDYSETAMPNLSEVMAYYGVQQVNGLVIEGDSSHSIRGYSHYLLPDINSHTITEPLQAKGYYVLMPLAQGIKKLEDARSTLTITNLLTTSGKAFSKPDGYNVTTMEKEAGDIAGPFALGVAVTEKAGEGETHIAWYTTSQMLDETVNQLVSGGNFDLFINSINWMADREESISIQAKALDGGYLTVSSSASAFWSVILIGILPIGFMVVGIYVWIRRKAR